MNDISKFSPYNSDYTLTLKGFARFELDSWIGRIFKNKKPPVIPGAQLLNLGAGEYPFPEFINADFFKGGTANKNINFWGLDIRYPLKCDNEHWDGVYTEHTLEHIYPYQTLALLREVHRTMKTGAWIRIIVPDISKYVDYYVGKPSDPLFSRWSPRGAALRSVTQNFLHFAAWDIELMTQCLEMAGFKVIRPRTFGEGADPRLIKDLSTRAYESLYIEAQK